MRVSVCVVVIGPPFAAALLYNGAAIRAITAKTIAEIMYPRILSLAADGGLSPRFKRDSAVTTLPISGGGGMKKSASPLTGCPSCAVMSPLGFHELRCIFMPI